MRAELLALVAVSALGCQTARADAAPKRAGPVASAMARAATVRFHVEGMACDRCSARLRDGLAKLAGVLAVEADHRKKEVVVRYDPGQLTPARIKGEIERYGFDAS